MKKEYREKAIHYLKIAIAAIGLLALLEELRSEPGSSLLNPWIIVIAMFAIEAAHSFGYESCKREIENETDKALLKSGLTKETVESVGEGRELDVKLAGKAIANNFLNKLNGGTQPKKGRN